MIKFVNFLKKSIGFPDLKVYNKHDSRYLYSFDIQKMQVRCTT